MRSFPEEELQAYLDGRLHSGATDELTAALRHDPALRKRLLVLAGFEEDLKVALRGGELGATEEPVVRRTSKGSGFWFRWIPLAAAAALVLCVWGVNVWQSKRAETAVVARVVEVRGEVSGFRVQCSGGESANIQHPTFNIQRSSGDGVKVGGTIRPGDGVVVGEDGFVKLAYADGSVVELEKETRMLLGAGQGTRLFGLVKELRGKRIQLDAGNLTARVANQKIGQAMALTTPHATATVLGTVLQLAVTPVSSELRVVEGKVEMVAGDQRELVGAGESAVVRDGVLSKEDTYEDGAVFYQDSFEKGFENWLLYTAKGVGKAGDRDTWPTTEAQCPDIRIVKVDRDGNPVAVAELVGKEPGGRRVGIVTKDLGKGTSDAYSLSYEYTYEGRQRRAMEGIEIDMGWRAADPPDLGRTRTQQARPAGKWNQVRWEYIRKTAPDGRRYNDARLYFNGEFIGRRSEYCEKDAPSPGLLLEVIDGQFRFANVVIREMKKAPGSK